MSASRDPIFAQKNFSFQVNVTAAKTTRSGVTNAVLLYTAPAEGAWIDRLWVRPGDTVATANRVDFYISPDGSAALPIDAIAVPTVTISATADIVEYQSAKWSVDNRLRLGPNQQLWAGLAAVFASGFVVCGQGEDFTSPALSGVTKSEGTATT